MSARPKREPRGRAVAVTPAMRAALSSLPCACCGATGYIEIDHILPVAHGGTNRPENLQPLCFRCNHAKGSYVVSMERLREVVAERTHRMSLTPSERRRYDRRKQFELYGYGRPPKKEPK